MLLRHGSKPEVLQGCCYDDAVHCRHQSVYKKHAKHGSAFSIVNIDIYECGDLICIDVVAFMTSAHL